jgi:FKBP-type peptidyl-prolyl cis-trans isomerase FklB
MMQQQEAAHGQNKALGEAFLEENKKRTEVITTSSGLQYEVLTEGNGQTPGKNDTVKVHYEGTLIDGTVFDSSYKRGNPASFGVHQVIPGWTEALQLMPVGAKYRLYIPQELAYGANPHPGGAIQPFSALLFDVELIEIL